MQGASEFETYEAFGAYHAAQLAQPEEEQSPAKEVMTAFLGFGLILFAIWHTVGYGGAM